MNKKRTFIIVSILILFLIIFPVTKPSANSFNHWLTKKYDIDCTGRESLSTYNAKRYKVVRMETDHYFLFNKTELELQIEDGGFAFVEGMGVLGGFIPFTYKPYYEK
jgi:prophage antirepressor-like protein